ncbi:MAG: hypothetical protein M3O34_01415, partial [Chloroflexota bacterium]|nr:hypothetical protein [Chloroflexota bacterium]
MGTLRRLAVPLVVVAVAVALRCQPTPVPYLLTIAELNGILGDAGRARALMVPRAEGWHLTTAAAIADRDGRSALLRVHGASFASTAEASSFYRSVAERLGP